MFAGGCGLKIVVIRHNFRAFGSGADSALVVISLDFLCGVVMGWYVLLLLNILSFCGNLLLRLLRFCSSEDFGLLGGLLFLGVNSFLGFLHLFMLMGGGE